MHDERQVEALARWAAGARRWALQRFRPGGHLDPTCGLAAPAPALLDAARAAAAAAGLAVVVR